MRELTDRRGFTKGLAAILAAGAAPNILIGEPLQRGYRGIGARLGMMAEGVEIPYNTQGLVAVWDGIWNAGLGAHDSSLQSWKELISGQDAVATGTLEWNDNRLHCVGTSHLTFQTTELDALFASLDNDFTVEIVSKADFVAKTSGYAGSFRIGDSSIRAWQFQNKYDSRQALYYACHSSNYTSALMNGAINFNTVSAVYDHAEENSQWYVNGARSYSVANKSSVANVNEISLGAASHGNFVGDIYSVRIYNRALTAEKVAANYTVDKARFNLT